MTAAVVHAKHTISALPNKSAYHPLQLCASHVLGVCPIAYLHSYDLQANSTSNQFRQSDDRHTAAMQHHENVRW